MAWFPILIPSTIGVRGATVDTGALQSAPLRTIDVQGSQGDQVAIDESQDGVNWTELVVLGGESQSTSLPSIARYYSARRLQVDPASLGMTAQLGAMVPSASQVPVLTGSAQRSSLSLLPLVQRIVPGNGGPADPTSLTWGVKMSGPGVVNSAAFDYQGNAANVAGQTCALLIVLNGATVHTGPALPTTAGEQGSLENGLGIAYNAGDFLSIQFTLSASLSGPLTLMTAQIGA
jgi:hypothetical protein